MEGKRFGKLLVIKKTELRKNHRVVWECICDCGKTCFVPGGYLTSGDTKSCGCILPRHFLRKTKQYMVWWAMIDRCKNASREGAKNYVLRGITVCDEWKKFINFWNDMKDNYKEGLQIDRIDNNLGYFKDNCRWVTPMVNQNNKRNNTPILYNLQIKNICEWSRFLNIKQTTLSNRINGNSSIGFGFKPGNKKLWDKLSDEEKLKYKAYPTS